MRRMDVELEQGWPCSGPMLRMAENVAKKLLPAFHTETGEFSLITQFFPTVPIFAVRETDVSWHNGGTSVAPLKPLRVDSVLGALSSLRGLREAPEVPPLCRETSVSRTANV